MSPVPDQDDTHWFMREVERVPDVREIGEYRHELAWANSTCTMVVTVFRYRCSSELFCAETRRNFGSFR